MVYLLLYLTTRFINHSETPITPIINGAKSWYAFGPISIQPSEFMKIILILALAKIVSNHNRFTFNKSFRTDLILFLKSLAYPWYL